MPKRKTKSIRALDKELRALVQKIVRMKARDKNGNCKCVTCGKVDSWTKMQGGHFIPSHNHPATRFMMSNIHGQCATCNKWLEGNRINYFKYMEKRYGRKYVDALIEKSYKNVKYTRDWYEEQISIRKKQIKQM